MNRPVVIAAFAVAAAGSASADRSPATVLAAQPILGSRSVPILTIRGLRFRDLDRDGRLSPYEDWRLSPERRAADLVARMTLEEKAGSMMHPVMGNTDQVTVDHVNVMLVRSTKQPESIAREINAFQEAAETTRLAIPVTVSSDPRNVFTATFGTGIAGSGFSQWPDATGFAAIGDPALVRRFGAIAAQEYRAAGITMALSPQADIASDPRWARSSGTFGDDPAKVAQLAAAYIAGFQGGTNGVTRTGVAAIVKHFAGYGAVKDGWDSHARYGRYATFPGGRFNEHVAVFRTSFRIKVAGVMPTYSMLELPGHPPVGAAFNQVLLQEILRRREGYRGLVLSDWSVTEDCRGPCLGQPAVDGARGLVGKPWGVENLSRAQRMVAAIKAGVDQIGFDPGNATVDSSPIVQAVQSGALPIARVNEAARHVMVIKFQVGLFENPYVDSTRAPQIVNQPAFRAAARDAQIRSLVLLENKGSLLPMRPVGKRVYLHGVEAEAAERAGFTVVSRPEQADVAIIRTVAPWQLVHPDYYFGLLQHEGDLDFKPDNEDLQIIRNAAAHVPTIVSVYLERPAILTEVRRYATALIGNFGVSDVALLAVVTGRRRPQGRLPFELPSSMAAANAQKPDVPHDSADPLYPTGFGRRFDHDAR